MPPLHGLPTRIRIARNTALHALDGAAHIANSALIDGFGDLHDIAAHASTEFGLAEHTATHLELRGLSAVSLRQALALARRNVRIEENAHQRLIGTSRRELVSLLGRARAEEGAAIDQHAQRVSTSDRLAEIIAFEQWVALAPSRFDTVVYRSAAGLSARLATHADRVQKRIDGHLADLAIHVGSARRQAATSAA